jgi:hypothetical protein
LNYVGGDVRYSPKISAFGRSARALVPFLEKLARSHGELLDRNQSTTPNEQEEITALVLAPESMPITGTEAFSGFVALSGWQPEEGPIPEAFLPRFHWATAPETTLVIQADDAKPARLEARLLSYSEQQVVTVLLNGTELTRLRFLRINQMEKLVVALPLEAGMNQVVLRYASWIESAADPRQLAVIFLGLRVVSG